MNKERVAARHKGGFGFRPVLCAADGEPLSVMLRAGNAAADSVCGHIAVLDAAVDQLAAAVAAGRRDGDDATRARGCSCAQTRPGALRRSRRPAGRATRECSTGCYDGGMSTEISQRQLRNDSGRIMRALSEGETFTITRNGEPVGALTPLRRRCFVRAEAAVELFGAAAPVDYESLRRDLDLVADQDPTVRA